MLSLSILSTAQVKKAMNDVNEGMESTGRQKRDVIKAPMADQQEKKVANVMEKLDDKQGSWITDSSIG